jgi:hypothetical protein
MSTIPQRIHIKKDISKVDVPDPEIVHKDRITIVGHVVHQHWGDNAIGLNFRHSEMLDLQIQPFQRRFEIPPEGVKLEKMVGMMMEPGHVGLIVIENRTGRGMLTNPTEEQRQAMKTMVLSVRFSNGAQKGVKVRPGFPMFVEPEDASEVSLVSLSDRSISINLYVYSR